MTKATLNILISNKKIIPQNCYEFYSDKGVTKKYHLRGLYSLHQGYLLEDASLKIANFKQALGYFVLALESEPNYFCAREALKSTAEILENYGVKGLDTIIDAEKYAIMMSENPHPGVCHLLHQGWFNAADLEETIKK